MGGAIRPSITTTLNKKAHMTETILKGRLDGKQRNRLKGLFDMLYTPKELAEEICIDIHQVYYVYVPLGCSIIQILCYKFRQITNRQFLCLSFIFMLLYSCKI
jgi:hypothetical protein